jgi:hypothetical protein
VKTGRQVNVFYHRKLEKFLQMDKSARNAKKSDIYSSIIAIYCLSKFTALAPLSLAYAPDKQRRVTVTLKTSRFGALYNLFLIMWIMVQ